MLNAVALAAFIVGTVTAVLRARGKPTARPATR
jgi:hypothetical protein